MAEPDPPRAGASRVVASTPEAVFAFLADLRNHWRLAEGLVTVDELDGGKASQGGRIELHGPLGLRRDARTQLRRVVEPAEGVGGVVEGTAETDAGTTMRITWSLGQAPTGTIVGLGLVVERAAPVDRLLLALGGRRWLERRLLERVLADLEDAVRDQRR